MDFDRPFTHRRQASSSSRGSMPPDTDYDIERDEEQDQAEQPFEDNDSEDDILPPSVPHGRAPQKVSVQQLKYRQEQPEIRSSKVLHASKAAGPAVSAETDWDPTTRLIFPPTGGQIRLLDQNSTIREITKDAIALSLYELGFKRGYETMVSRPAFVRRLMRICAKKHPQGSHVERRAKEDTTFCGRLAPIICTRGSNVRTMLRSSALSKVATHYELTKPGNTASRVRALVKQLLADQQFILPYAPATARAPPDPVNVGEGDVVAVSESGPEKSFIVALPFHAPAIVDLIHECWWSGSKSLGFTYIKKLKSYHPDRPNEVVLPDAMMCLGATFIWGALQCYSTGRFVPASEFSEARLENTYTSLADVLEKQRAGPSAKRFNKTMHDLYVNVSHSQSAAAPGASGSANNVICLEIDSD
ncbi:hypothetical protein B0H16DRAFT_199164 [Mycena metata]|uniref:DUF6532 domain-containing protein n=1 Tax=Mycena metata TaxID=1033252 RepID=A0AAD7MUU9_9AGAR|nr:hypothetical protein B0H16DRAFT_199164 [Mycena metata]